MLCVVLGVSQEAVYYKDSVWLFVRKHGSMNEKRLFDKVNSCTTKQRKTEVQKRETNQSENHNSFKAFF